MKEAFPAMYKGIIASMTVNVLKAEPVAVLTEDDDVLIITEHERKAVRITHTLPAANRWIPCSERMPEIGIDVIVFYPHWGNKPIQVAHLNYDKLTYELSDGEFNLPVSAVTHWMPMPEPPKEDET